jgi:hypothetical protein
MSADRSAPTAPTLATEAKIGRRARPANDTGAATRATQTVRRLLRHRPSPTAKTADRTPTDVRRPRRIAVMSPLVPARGRAPASPRALAARAGSRP